MIGLGAAVFLRILYLVQYSRTPLFGVAVGADIMEYDRWARDILVNGIGWDRIRIHAPLYPLVLSVFYRFTGVSVGAVRCIQLGMDMVSLVMVSLAVGRLWGRRAAVCCIWCWALFLPIVYYSAELISEGLVVFFLSAALYFLSYDTGKPVSGSPFFWLRLIAVGLCCGLAAISHPLALPFGLALLLVFPWSVSHCSPRLRLVSGLVIAWGLFLPILPVALRNHAVSGEWILIQGNTGLNLYIGNNPDATGTCYLRPGPAYDHLAGWPSRAGVKGTKASAAFFRKKVFEFACRQPCRQGGLLLRKLILTWNHVDIPSGADLPDLQHLVPLMRMPLPRFAVLAPLALAAVFLSWRDRRTLPYILLIATYTFGLTLFVTSGRYRLGMLPAVIGLSGLGCSRLAELWSRAEGQALLRRTLVVIGLAGLLTLLPSAPTIGGEDREADLLLGEAAWRSGNLVLARQTLARSLARFPTDGPLWHLYGNVLTQSGAVATAVSALQRAVELQPQNPIPRVDLGIVLSDQGDLAGAGKCFDQALQLDPLCSSAHYNQGVLAERKGDVAAAEKHYRLARAGDSVSVSASLNLAVLLHRQGRRQEARSLYAAVLRLDPRKYNAIVGMGVLCLEQGNIEAARKWLERALRIRPDAAAVRAIFQTLPATDNSNSLPSSPSRSS